MTGGLASSAVRVVPVVHWPDGRPDATVWDRNIVDLLLGGALGRPAGWPAFDEVQSLATANELAGGAIVHISGSKCTGMTSELNAALAPLSWVLLIITTDEEHLFDLADFDHPNRVVWRQLPRTDHEDFDLVDRGFGEGVPPATVIPWQERDLDWSFAGQVTTPRRESWWDELNARARRVGWPQGPESSVLVASRRFAGGVDRRAYLDIVARSRVVAAPAGVASQSSFRVFEALEAGAVPIVDHHRRDGRGEGYWHAIFHEPSMLFEAHDYPGNVDVNLTGALENGEWLRLATWAWWTREKRWLAVDLVDSLRRLDALPESNGGLRDRLTAVVTVSPIKSHPSVEVLVETIDSLPKPIDIVVAFDAPHPDDDPGMVAGYLEHLDAWLANMTEADSNRLVPVVAPEWLHQAQLTRLALQQVTTEAVLFVEHDTPIEGDVPWENLVDLIEGPTLDVVRLYPFPKIPDEHQYLMDQGVRSQAGVPLLGTTQWSQRPHVADTDWYREMLDTEFSVDARTMIEDVIHGRAQSQPDRFRLAIYHPDDGLQRSIHLDGRAGGPKHTMTNRGEVVG